MTSNLIARVHKHHRWAGWAASFLAAVIGCAPAGTDDPPAPTPARTIVALEGTVAVEFPVGSAARSVSNNTGMVRLTLQEDDEGGLRLTRYEGVLPGFLTAGTVTVDVDLETGSVGGTIIQPGASPLGLGALYPELRMAAVAFGHGLDLTTSTGPDRHEYSLTFDGLPTSLGDGATIDRIETAVRATHRQYIDNELVVDDQGTGSLEAAGVSADDQRAELPYPPAPIIVDAGTDQTLRLGESVSLTPTIAGGQSPLHFAWSPAAGLQDAGVEQPLASPLTTTTYTLVVTDEAGQQASDSLTVFVEADEEGDDDPDEDDVTSSYLEQMQFISLAGLGEKPALSIDGDVLYVAGSNGVHAFDVTDPAYPQLLAMRTSGWENLPNFGSFYHPGGYLVRPDNGAGTAQVWCVKTADGLMVWAGDYDLAVFPSAVNNDFDVPVQPWDYANHLLRVQGRLYSIRETLGGSALQRWEEPVLQEVDYLDVPKFTEPEFEAEGDCKCSCYGRLAYRDRLFASKDCVFELNAQNGAVSYRGRLEGGDTVLSSVTDIDIAHGRIWRTGYSELEVYEIGASGAPRYITEMVTNDSSVHEVEAMGDWVVITAGTDTSPTTHDLEVYGLTDGGELVLLQGIDLPDHVGRLLRHGEYLYAAGDTGLTVLRATPGTVHDEGNEGDDVVVDEPDEPEEPDEDVVIEEEEETLAVSATLTDGVTGNPVPGITVWLNSSPDFASQEAITSAAGTVAFEVPFTSRFKFVAYDPDGTYWGWSTWVYPEEGDLAFELDVPLERQVEPSDDGTILIVASLARDDRWDVASGMDDPDVVYNVGDELWHYDAATRRHKKLFEIDTTSSWPFSNRSPQVSSDGAFASCRGTGDYSWTDVVVGIDVAGGIVTKQIGAKDGDVKNDPEMVGVSDLGLRSLVFPSRFSWGWDPDMAPDGCECGSTVGFHAFPPAEWWPLYFGAPGGLCHWFQNSQAYIHGGDSNCGGGGWSNGPGTHHEIWWTKIDDQSFEHTTCEIGFWWIGAFAQLRSVDAEIQLLSDSPVTGYDAPYGAEGVGVSDDDAYIAYIGEARDGSGTHAVVVWDVDDSCDSSRKIRSTSNTIANLSVSGGAATFVAAWTEEEQNLFAIAPRDGDVFFVRCPDENAVGPIHARRVSSNRIRAIMRTDAVWLDRWLWVQDFVREADGAWRAASAAVPLYDLVQHPDWREGSAGGGRLTPNGRLAIVEWSGGLYRVPLPATIPSR